MIFYRTSVFMCGVDLTWSEHLMLPDWIFTLIMCGGVDPCLVLCIKYLKCILIFLANTVKKKCSRALLEVQQFVSKSLDGSFLVLAFVCCTITKHSPLWLSAA